MFEMPAPAAIEPVTGAQTGHYGGNKKSGAGINVPGEIFHRIADRQIKRSVFF
jgi:hypothetical protein